MSTHTAIVTREGKWWMVSVPSVDGLTQARRVSEVGRMARELVAVTLNVRVEDVAIDLRFEDIAGVHLSVCLEAIHKEKAEAARLEQDAARKTAELANALVAQHVPLRDVGEMLGVSFQRVHQLVK